MKKTIKIKLGGVIFHIDEDAYSMLKKYLNSLADYFKAKEEGKEIIEDIESRIAEIFQQMISDTKEVISQGDVTSMIEIMGEAKEIIDEEDTHEAAGPGKTYSTTGKRLYRDPDNAVLGGVCSGLGAYFNADPIWFRIIFLVLLLVYGVGLVYIILWIVLPKAETAAQKLEMRGENITVQNIEKAVKEEFETMKENLGKIKDTKSYNRTTEAFHNFFAAIGDIFIFILRAILVLIGVVFILAGFISLVSFLGALIFSNSMFFSDIFDIPRFHLPHILPVFTDTANISLLIVALLLTVLIPLIALIYGGIKMVFRLKVNDKAIGLTALIIWIISLAGLASIALFEGANYAEYAEIETTHDLHNTYDTIYLQMKDKPSGFMQEDLLRLEINNEGIYRDHETGIIYGKPCLDIKSSESGRLELQIEKESRGRSSQLAWEHARELEYQWDIKDSLLLFDYYFKLPDKQRWRAPYMKLILMVPEGNVIYIDEDMTNIIGKLETPDYYKSYGLVGKGWKATNKGFVELDE